ncbi:peptidoglycan-binding protein [Alicyclobacillus fodiniaquatilis]|uniref:Peptidoglycan-binding protein n=1 Tax=Alicyclobacillus fodiniaquatilis TaxID=1661150 RepID=A0ABW4JKC3_9BACL
MKTQRLLAVMTLPALLTITVPVIAHAQSSTETTVQSGSEGASVTQLQNDLNALGYTVGQADGDFGPETLTQTEAFQKARKLQVDGVVGPSTWSALDTAMAAFASQPITLGASSTAVKDLETKQIYYNNKLITSPYGFTYQNTDYMPIWYVMHTLDQEGLSHTWSNGVWNITVPKSVAANIDYSNIKYGKGSTCIAINGTVVERVDGVVHVDPASKSQTTFLPIWYVEQALNRIGIQSNWQGTVWKMTAPPSTGSTGSSGDTGSTTGSTGSSGDTGSTTGSTGSSGDTGSTTGSTGSSGGTGSTTGSTGSSGGTGSTTGSTGGSFNNVDLRFPAPADVNAQTINQYLTNHDSPMNGLGESFMEAQSTYGVDANYLVSHAILESYWGQSQIALAKNNLFGYGAYDSNPGSDAGLFPSNDYAIRFQAWEVRNNYLNPGGSEYVSPTLNGMNVHYATDPQWATSIGGLMSQFATSVGSSVSDYQQYSANDNAPQPSSTTEPVYYLNGATAVTQGSTYYNNGVPYYASMGAGVDDMFFGPLQNGSSGEPVSEVQTYLNNHMNAGLTVDGQYGPATTAAVKQFQTMNNITSTAGVWSYAMWQTYIEPESTTPTIPAGQTVNVDEIEQGMANGYVVPWFHIPNKGWVDSQYVKFSNVYRITVANPAGTSTSVPVYGSASGGTALLTLHSGDFVVSKSPTPVNGMIQIQFAAQTAGTSGGKAPGTLMTGYISTQNATLTAQQ